MNVLVFSLSRSLFFYFFLGFHVQKESGSFRSYSRSVRSFRPGSFRPDFLGESFRPSWGGSFWPNFIGGSFWPGFWGESFRLDLYIMGK